MTEVPRLVTFAPMIDSEMWRLLLRHYAIPYAEEPHAFLWGSVLALFRAGSVQVPALCGDGFDMVDPQAAIDRWDAVQPPGHALIPADPVQRAQALEDWDTFHGTLATATARLAYFHLLPRRDIMLEPFTRGVPRWEATLTHVIYLVQRGALSLALQLTAANADAALAQIRTIADATERRIRDGRRFLLGERPTLGDVALAAAAAPVVLPPGNLSPIPALADMPPAFAAIVREMQARPLGAFVRGLYATLGA